MCAQLISCTYLFDSMDYSTPGSSVHRIFYRQEYWNGLPFPFPGDLPDSGIPPPSLVPPVLAGRFLPLTPRGKPKCFDTMDSSLPASSVHGILLVRILEWVAMYSSRYLSDPGI